MIVIKREVTDPAAPPMLLVKAFVPNPDGTVSLLMPDGTYAFQEPMQYGIFGRDPSPAGAYQRAKLNGQLISFWTRPQDPIYTYTWAELPNS